MDRHDGARARGDAFLDLVNIDAPRVWVTVHQDRNTLTLNDGQSARDDRKCGKDDLVSGGEFETRNSDLQGSGAIADRDAVTPSAVSCPSLLEFIDKSACGRDPACPHAFQEILGFPRAEERLIHRYDCQNRSLS